MGKKLLGQLSLFLFLILIIFISKFQGIGAVFRVSSDMSTSTAADRRLPNTDVVLALLKWIERFMMHRKPRYCASLSISTNLATHTASPTEPIKSEIDVKIWKNISDFFYSRSVALSILNVYHTERPRLIEAFGWCNQPTYRKVLYELNSEFLDSIEWNVSNSRIITFVVDSTLISNFQSQLGRIDFFRIIWRENLGTANQNMPKLLRMTSHSTLENQQKNTPSACRKWWVCDVSGRLGFSSRIVHATIVRFNDSCPTMK